MMFAAANSRIEWQKLRLNQPELLRALVAGTAWGVLMSAGLAGMMAWNYGMVCLDDVASTTAISIAAGILAIGPLAAYGRR